MDQRVDLYTEVHKGLRRALTGLLSDAGRLDATDPKAVADFNDELGFLTGLLMEHAENEETYVQPLLDPAETNLAATIEAAHQELETEINAVVEVYRQLGEADEEQAPSSGNRAYYQLAGFIGLYLVHMSTEELDVMPYLQGRLSDPELMDVQNQLRASIAPPRMADYLRLMIPAMNIQERTAMFSGMKAVAPPEALEGACQLAASVLDEREWHDLRDRVGL